MGIYADREALIMLAAAILVATSEQPDGDVKMKAAVTLARALYKEVKEQESMAHLEAYNAAHAMDFENLNEGTS